LRIGCRAKYCEKWGRKIWDGEIFAREVRQFVVFKGYYQNGQNEEDEMA